MKFNQLYQLINEVLNKPKKDDCDCGCGGCDNAPILTESKVKSLLSEGLNHHISNAIPLHETIYRYGSVKHLSLIKEARKLYSRNVISLSEQDVELIKTNLGEWGIFEGESVPLDLPMMDESLDENLDKVAGGIPYKIEGNKAIISEPLDDATKERIIKRCKEAGYKCSPNQAGGVTIFKEVQLDEKKKAKTKKKDPPIGKPKRGGSKAYYVYVRDPKTKKIKKVSFGSGGLRAKINNPKARNAFAKRHRCSTKNDRTKPGYWSCRLPRYAKALGLGNNKNTFW